MADSPIRLPTPSNRQIAATGAHDAATDSGNVPATPPANLVARLGSVVHPVQLPQVSERFANWAHRVGIIKLIWFALAVVVPTLGASIYYFGLAANQYVSEFLCVVRPVEDVGNTSVGSFMTSAAGSQTALESNVVVQYIKSAEIVSQLEQQISLRALYSNTRADFWARLNPESANEDLVAYWGTKIEPFYDMTTGTVSVRVTAFAPQDAQLIASQVIHLSEGLINGMSERARRDAVRLDEEEVKNASDQLSQLRRKLLDFRNQQQMIDPKGEAASSLSLISKLREQLALARADLETYGTASQAPGAKVLQNRIDALRQQIAAASAPLTNKAGSDNDQALSVSIGGFEELDAKRQVAEKYYDSALSALEKAKYDADRQMTYLAVFVEPNLPQSSTYPRRTMSVVLTLLAGFGLWIFGIIIAHSIREHV